MKGRLNKLSRGWVVEYVFPGPPFVGELPILMDEDSDSFVLGDEVNFEISNQWYVDEHDMETMREYAKLIPEVEEVEPYNYWKERCLAAEKFIDLSPCDPDIHGDQWIVRNEWIKLINKQIKWKN
jgi:hypothetical protein